VRKEKRSLVRGHELGKPFSPSPEKEDRSDLRITIHQLWAKLIQVWI